MLWVWAFESAGFAADLKPWLWRFVVEFHFGDEAGAVYPKMKLAGNGGPVAHGDYARHHLETITDPGVAAYGRHVEV
jgi:hypothetical protein